MVYFFKYRWFFIATPCYLSGLVYFSNRIESDVQATNNFIMLLLEYLKSNNVNTSNNYKMKVYKNNQNLYTIKINFDNDNKDYIYTFESNLVNELESLSLFQSKISLQKNYQQLDYLPIDFSSFPIINEYLSFKNSMEKDIITVRGKYFNCRYLMLRSLMIVESSYFKNKITRLYPKLENLTEPEVSIPKNKIKQFLKKYFITFKTLSLDYPLYNIDTKYNLKSKFFPLYQSSLFYSKHMEKMEDERGNQENNLMGYFRLKDKVIDINNHLNNEDLHNKSLFLSSINSSNKFSDIKYITPGNYFKTVEITNTKHIDNRSAYDTSLSFDNIYLKNKNDINFSENEYEKLNDKKYKIGCIMTYSFYLGFLLVLFLEVIYRRFKFHSRMQHFDTNRLAEVTLNEDKKRSLGSLYFIPFISYIKNKRLSETILINFRSLKMNFYEKLTMIKNKK